MVHGLRVRLDGDLATGLAPTSGGRPDILVHAQRRPGWAAEGLDESRMLFVARPDDATGSLVDVGPMRGGAGTRMRFAEGATFWIAAALDEIWLEYEPPLTGADAAYFLIEPVLAFVLRCRGTLVLHASAVVVGGRAVVFCGPAGSGKSTTAAAGIAAGHPLLSDDVVALSERQGQWLAHRGATTVRLWDAGAQAVGLDADRLPRFSPTWDKRILVAADSELARDDAVPVRLVCVLGGQASGGAPRRVLEPIEGALTVRALLAHTAANYLHDAARRATELSQLAQLAAAVPVVSIAVHQPVARLPALIDAVRAACDA